MPAVQELGQDAAQATAEGKAEARALGGLQKGDDWDGNKCGHFRKPLEYVGICLN